MRSFFKCVTVSVGMLAALGTGGCGSGDFEARSSEPGAAGAAGAPADDAGTQADSGKPTKPEPTAGCVAKPGVDEPDDAFVDTNCDGIDGDAAQAVFVNPEGDDAASGASDAPVKTLGKAIEIATAASKDVYVCNATFAENVSLAKSVRLFGGYDCDTWERNDKHATVAPSTGIPLRVSKVTDAAFEAIDFVAPDAVDASASSIAVMVAQSTGIAFRRSVLDAGMGANGTPGTSGAAFSSAAPNGADGQANKVSSCSVYSPPVGDCGSMPSGGDSNSSVCSSLPTTASRGGKGGNGGNKQKNVLATNGATALNGGAGGKAMASGGAAAQPGPAGTAGTNGTPGGDIGSIVNGEYIASNVGTAGTSGTIGRGGGGGAGGWSDWNCQDLCTTYFIGSGGGQGGYGGCGGSAGTAGGAGGASIAVLVIDSAVELSESTLRTSQGGKGGNAGKGGAGQPGGQGGKGGTSSNGKVMSWGKVGGAGGKGGDGGAGGPGGGGASVAIIVHGATQPTTTSITFDLGTPGAGGLTASGAAGTAGASSSMLTL